MSFVMQHGIKLNDSFVKTHRPRGLNMPLYCPFSTCMREFHETGNLKTHIRIHVSTSRLTLPDWGASVCVRLRWLREALHHQGPSEDA